MDAPAHFGRGRNHVHLVPLDRLIGPGCIINVKKKVENNHDYALSVSDLEDWEKMYGKIPEKAIVIMNSGWDKYKDDELKAWGTNNITDTTSYHTPGWSAQSITWLVKNRRINMIGVDTPSIDIGQTTKFEAHVAGAMNDLSMLENVVNLDKIPPSGTIIYAAVTKILDGSGAPTRVFAVVGDNTSGTSRVQYTWSLLLCIVSAILTFL
ncbi:hypothetical protein KUTeg_002441 [Tegillarca granosa]|uniref:Uncharacterized protein n=1 Tax=Tegillarca granosa TaxID=220873 RepID=A0ABQ9FUB0_TEGGR|nr:hypothetical protein KUTeg_002441 [Tegillarca granosa]